MLPALKMLTLYQRSGSAGPDGVLRLAEGLVAGALPALSVLSIDGMHVGEAGASALAAALDRGALPQLEGLALYSAAIDDAALAALAPALRRRPALGYLHLERNPFGDDGLAALVAPPPPAGTPPLPAGGLKKLKELFFNGTEITDAGCAALVAALESGALPSLEETDLDGTPAGAAAVEAVHEAMARLRTAQAAVHKEFKLTDISASDAAIEAVREAMASSRAA